MRTTELNKDRGNGTILEREMIHVDARKNK